MMTYQFFHPKEVHPERWRVAEVQNTAHHLPRKPVWRTLDTERDPNQGLIDHPIAYRRSRANMKLCPKSWNIKIWNM